MAEHRPDLAVRSLRAAVAACPATRAGELSLCLYSLALALFRLDRPELAIRSLASAQKLRPRGVARAAYEKRINPYGMYRRSCEELDDFYAFYSIKAGAYLGSKGRGQFDSTLEKDTVTRIIGDAWRSLSATGRLGSLATKEKLKLFASWAVAFPSFGLERRDPAQVIQANFRRGSRQMLDDRCNCGSGLPYIRCCGRLSSPSEFSCE